MCSFKIELLNDFGDTHFGQDRIEWLNEHAAGKWTRELAYYDRNRRKSYTVIVDRVQAAMCAQRLRGFVRMRPLRDT